MTDPQSKTIRTIFTDLELAMKFHETYERLAPDFGYETRDDTKQFDPQSKNGKLMIAVCHEVNEKVKTDISKIIDEVINKDRTATQDKIAKMVIKNPETDIDMGWNSAIFEAANSVEVKPEQANLKEKDIRRNELERLVGAMVDFLLDYLRTRKEELENGTRTGQEIRSNATRWPNSQ